MHVATVGPAEFGDGARRPACQARVDVRRQFRPRQRLEAGSRLEEGLLAFTDESFGLERMVAVLTEAPPGSETEDLSFLEQGKVPPATRAVGGQNPLSSMLDQIA